MDNDDFLDDLGIGKTPFSQLLDNLTEEYWSRQSTRPCEGWPNKSITSFYNTCGKISFTHNKKRKITKKKLRQEIYKRLKGHRKYGLLSAMREERAYYERHWLKKQPITWEQVQDKINTHVNFYYVCFHTDGKMSLVNDKKDIPKDVFKHNWQPMYYDFGAEEVRSSSCYTRAHLDESMYVYED